MINTARAVTAPPVQRLKLAPALSPTKTIRMAVPTVGSKPASTLQLAALATMNGSAHLPVACRVITSWVMAATIRLIRITSPWPDNEA